MESKKKINFKDKAVRNGVGNFEIGLQGQVGYIEKKERHYFISFLKNTQIIKQNE